MGWERGADAGDPGTGREESIVESQKILKIDKPLSAQLLKRHN